MPSSLGNELQAEENNDDGDGDDDDGDYNSNNDYFDDDDDDLDPFSESTDARSLASSTSATADDA
jgi:hypothetical protein